MLLAELFRDLSGIYNHAEVVIWPTMGLVLLLVGLRRMGVVRRDYWLAGLVLIQFGATDYFESENGNEWWTPWWLFLWKALSVLAMLLVLYTAGRRHRRIRIAPLALTPSQAVSQGHSPLANVKSSG